MDTFLNSTDGISVSNGLSTRRPIALPITITLCGSLAVVGNAMVLIILGKHPNLLESTRKFCMHLAVTDLGNGFLSFIFIYSIMGSGRNVNLCTYVLLVLKFFVVVSQAVLTVNTFERYVGICKRADYARIMKKSTVNTLLFLAWFYPVLLVSGSIVGFSPKLYQSSCFYHLVFQKWVYLAEATCMFSAAVINIVLFGFIIAKACTFYNRVSPASLHGTSNKAVRNRGMEKSIRNGKMMALVTTAFLVCWMPFNVYQTYVGFGGIVSDGLLTAGNSMYLLGISNSIINPFIYVWQKKEFRDRFKIILKCRQSQNANSARTEAWASPNCPEHACPNTSNTMRYIAGDGTLQQTVEKPLGTITQFDNDEDITTIEID